MQCKKRGTILVFLVLILLVLSFFVTAEEGCYVYPQGSEAYYCVDSVSREEAEEDCVEYSDCDMEQHFIPGAICTEQYDECQLVKCSVDCSFHPLGICEQLGLERGEDESMKGVAVSVEEENEWCAPRCCRAGPYCSRGLVNKWECLLGAKRSGLPITEIRSNFDIDTGQCINEWCGIALEDGSLAGYVYDQAEQPLQNVRVRLETGEETLSKDDGGYEFQKVSTGSHVARASLGGYATQSKEVIIAANEVTNADFTLLPSGEVGLRGKVVNAANQQGIAKAALSWTGTSEGVVITDDEGNYGIAELSPGDYVFTASKSGYSSVDYQITLVDAVVEHTFALGSKAAQGILGTTFVDEVETYGVTIFVDGVRKGFSRPPDGYQVTLEPGEYQITASLGEYSAGPMTASVEPDATTQLDLELTRLIPECGPGNFEPVEVFFSSPVLGKSEVRLQWEKPCPEVLRYEIKRLLDGQEIGMSLSASPLDFFVIDDDESIGWGMTLQYEITVVYASGASVSVTSSPVYVGDKECKGMYHDDRADNFCLVDRKETAIDEGKMVWTCDENKMVPSDDCSTRDNVGNWYCAPIGDTARCKDSEGCLSFIQSADPFGLYYERTKCYGSDEPEISTANFCYFDTTSTIVDKCETCSKVKDCFDYQSRDACVINNCLSQQCNWVEVASNTQLIDYGHIFPGMVTQEMGMGYCVPERYDDDDWCSACGPQGELFENNYCTAETCSGLGRCYSEPGLAKCNVCGDAASLEANCYTYQSELECTNNEEGFTVSNGQLLLSADRCGWGKCKWQGGEASSGYHCVKDADNDGMDDCREFSNEEQGICKKDNEPPVTVVPRGTPVISMATPEIVIQSIDNLFVGSFYYCLIDAESNAQDYCGPEEYADSRVEFPILGPEGEITVNLLDAMGEKVRPVSGRTYRLKYFSKDRYFNQEEVKETFVFVDNVEPEFAISAESATTADRTTLQVFLDGESEAMSCDFSLTPVLPAGGEVVKSVGRGVRGKSVTFDNLPGIYYNLNVTCTDDNGNINSRAQWFTFDQEQDIDILSPVVGGVMAKTRIGFQVHTDVGAICELRTVARDEKVADFITDEEWKVHRTELLPGFVEKDYFDTYKVVCRELLTDEEHEDYFSFTVDFTAPETQVILQEGFRMTGPTKYDWEESFVNGARVDFDCQSEGFDCEQTFYCLGYGCEFKSDVRYQEYAGTVEVNGSTRICYYSIDEGGNSVVPFCGNIDVVGYGVTLENPGLYLFDGEVWGVSSVPSFDWTFSVKVPTQECRFDFSPGFIYEEVPEFRVLTADSDKIYTFPQFPNESGANEFDEEGGTKPVYVQCTNMGEQLGPEQKINLEYDPTPPEIMDILVEPNPLVEGTKVKISLRTDDKTICKFSDLGHTEYELMNNVFLGAESFPAILEKNHVAEFTANTGGEIIRKYNLTFLCKNGAGDISEMKQMDFTVDYSQVGAISAAWPKGDHFAVTSVVMSVQTTRNAICEYRKNGTTAAFVSEDGKSHSAALDNIAEGVNSYVIGCTMGEHTAEDEISFKVDLTPPVISEVVDGNYTCGKSNIGVLAHAEGEKIIAYSYEVYDQGEEKAEEESNAVSRYYSYSRYKSSSTSGTSTVGGDLVFSGTVTGELPIKVPAGNLSKNHKYIIKVKAQDAAGHWGSFKASDGVVVNSGNHSSCASDTTLPTVNVKINGSQCTYLDVHLYCNDNSGECSTLKYAKKILPSCTELNDYSGGNEILFRESGYLCYYAEDDSGNNVSDNKRITFADSDGDGVMDNCDECLDTGPGKVADGVGCAVGQVSESEKREDVDDDGLPDRWEKDYSDCGMHYLSKDADQNGVMDIDEDYDADGYSSREEYLSGTDPCVSDAPLSGPGHERLPEEGEAEVLEEVGAKEEIEKPKDFSTIPAAEEEQTEVLPLVLLIIGLLMIFGGIGYLVYYYKSSPAKVARPSVAGVASASAKSSGGPGVVSQWKQRLFRVRKSRAEKTRKRTRESLFGGFGFNRKSKEIPHVEKALHQSGPHLPRLHELAHDYHDNKEKIQPGLQHHEKGIFAKLEGIAHKTKDKKIHEVVSKDEAHDIFAKLKNISNKRKEG